MMNFNYLKKFMDRLVEWRIPGNSIVVYKDNRMVFSYQSGYSNLEQKKKMTGNELFNIYSCSKIATIVAALQLYEQGIFLLSDPLYEYIPEFRKMCVIRKDKTPVEAKNPITIQNLFTMTAGFSYDMKDPIFETARCITDNKMNTLEVIKCMSKMPLSFEPGEKWQYGFCHDVLAALVEVISGQKFRNYVAENIFKPLEMTHSYYHYNQAIDKQMAEQYEFIDNDEKTDIVKSQSKESNANGKVINVGKQTACVFGCEYDSGGGGIISSVEDYAKFAAALANFGCGINGEQILSRGTVELLKTNQLNDKQMVDINWPQLKGYGYGLGVRTLVNKSIGGSNGSIGEFGWGGAAGSTMLMDTEQNLALFYAHHMLNPQEDYYQPRLRNVIYSCLE